MHEQDGGQATPCEAQVNNARGAPAAQLAWHPRLPLLAIGWKDGGSHSSRGSTVPSLGRAVATLAPSRSLHMLAAEALSADHMQLMTPWRFLGMHAYHTCDLPVEQLLELERRRRACLWLHPCLLASNITHG
jgi:hypothetical protein